MYITHPKTRRKIFLDNSLTSYEDRLSVVQEKILNEDIINYCQDNAIIKNSRQELSHETAERILENCATFLLLGQYKENNIMTIYKIRQAQVMEIPISSTDSNAEDLLYSANSSDETQFSGLTASTEITYNNDVRDEQTLSNQDIVRREKKKTKQGVRYKNSRAYRMERLYSTRPILTYRIKQKFFIDEEGKRKPEKNAYGQPIFQAVYGVIGGHRGLIDENNKYQSRWCIVDTDNNFCYNSNRFKLDNSLKQYEVDKNNRCLMEKILVVPTKDGLIFFDEDIREIPKDRVLQN